MIVSSTTRPSDEVVAVVDCRLHVHADDGPENRALQGSHSQSLLIR